MTVLFSIIQVLNTGPVSEIGQMGNFLTTKRRPPVSTVKSEFPGYNGKGFQPPEKNETEGFRLLGHPNWTKCSPLSQFCSGNFATFSLSYWGANSYYPRGLILGVGRISHLPIWMTERGLSAWGIQTGPFASP